MNRPARGPAGRSGVILPAALFILLAGTLLGASLLATARLSLILSDGDRGLAEALARRPIPPERVAEALEYGTGAIRVFPLGEGFNLIEEPVERTGWSLWSIVWVPQMVRVAMELPAATVTGGELVVDGGELVAGITQDGCAGVDPFDPFPLHLRRVELRPPFPEPALPARPRFGPVALEALFERADPVLLPGAELPGRWGGWGEEETRTLSGAAGLAGLEGEPGAGRISGGAGRGILVSSGDLILEGDTRFEGLVLVSGSLILRGSVELQGAIEVGGSLRIEEGARLAGCRSSVADAGEGIAPLAVPFPVAGGGFLGRF